MQFKNVKKFLMSIKKEMIKTVKQEQIEIENVMVDLGLQGEKTDDIDFPTFLRIAAIKFKQREFVSALEETFKSFDKEGKEYLTYEELKTILTDYGPKLTNDEADDLLKDVIDSKEKFKYKDFVKKNF